VRAAVAYFAAAAFLISLISALPRAREKVVAGQQFEFDAF
jgi:hypothetical protein